MLSLNVLQNSLRVKQLIAISEAGSPPVRLAIASTMLLTFQSILTIITAYPSGTLIDNLQRKALQPFIVSLFEITGIGIALIATQFASKITFATLNQILIRNVGVRVFSALQGGLADREVATPGEMVNRVTSDVETACDTLLNCIVPGIQSVLTLMTAVVLMFAMNWRLAIAAVGFLPLWAVLLNRTSHPETIAVRNRLLRATDEVKQIAVDRLSFTGISRGEIYQSQAFDRQTFSDAVSTAMELSLQLTGRLARSWVALALVGSVIGEATTLAVGGWEVWHEMATAGTIVAFLAIQAQLFGPIGTLSGVQIGVSTNIPVLDRICNALSSARPREAIEAPVQDEKSIRAVGLTISFGGEKLIENFSHVFAVGTWTAIIGPSGCGKTSLARVLARLAIADAGHVETSQSVLFCPHNDSLFHGTIADNISLGRQVSAAHIAQVLSIVEMLDSIEALPDGLNSNIEQIGQAFSAGERQRLCLARSLLTNPDCLVLDEATSAIAPEQEARILNRLRSFQGLTIICISHRLETIKLFDKVLRPLWLREAL